MATFKYTEIKHNDALISDSNPLPTTQQLKIDTVIDETAYDLNAAAYSATITPEYDYIIDNVSFDFSCSESKTITITSDNGSKIYEDTNSNLSVVVSSINFGQSAGQSFTIQVTQTSGTCTADITANIKNSPVALTSDPILAEGSVVETINNGHICTDNSSSENILADDTFEGEWQDTLDYNVIIIGIKSDKDSATDGLCICWSSDGVTTHDDDVFTILANKGKVFTFSPARRYVKITYTNGGVDTTAFNLQTIFKKAGFKGSSHRINDSIVSEDDAELVKAVLTGEDPDNNFNNVQTTKDGNLVIADNSSGLAIAEGLVTGKTFVHKFGLAPDFDYSDGEVNIWDGANDGGLNQMIYVWSTADDIDTISSSNAGDTQTIQLQGTDNDLNLVVQTATLDGQNKVTLSTPLKRIFRAKNTGTTALAGSVYVYEDTTISSGVPTDSTKVRLLIDNGNNQTLMAIYSVPNGKTAYMRSWYASTAGASKTSQYIIRLWAREYLEASSAYGAWQLKQIMSISDGGTSYLQHVYEDPQTFKEKVDIMMTVQATATGASAAAVSAGFDLVLKDN